jgi:protoporphyrinogen oxidase
MKNKGVFILGGGITGLSAGINTKLPIYEAKKIAGGICASYYVKPPSHVYCSRHDDAYRFEMGGGHWIFGADEKIKSFINRFSPTKTYARNSAVYLPDLNLYVPYPIQNNLSYLPSDIKQQALSEILKAKSYKKINTLSDWLNNCFGNTLYKLFFHPFHNLYTAGLHTKIAPQYKYKTPLDKKLIVGTHKNKSVGYNATFIYPKKGLDYLISNLAEHCKINFSKKIIKINCKTKEIFFKNHASVKYEKVISTLPLNQILEMSKLTIDERPAPYTSVLVINIGAKKGIKCPPYHWVYIPKSRAGFHRVGFYSNIDMAFLPLRLKGKSEKTSIYVEKSFQGGQKPTVKEIKKICKDAIEELKEWKYITSIDVIHTNWVEVAYTWEYPNSQWRLKGIDVLKKHNIYQVGRYGGWKFQGIAESIKEGLTSQSYINKI